MKRLSAIALLFLLIITAVAAQDTATSQNQDSLIVESQDTVLLKTYAARYSPRKALLYAAVLPGLGQIYNKKYWKLPLVYGGFISLGYGINWYSGLYKEYKKELFINLEMGLGDNDIRPGSRTTTRGYRVAVDKAKRERDFMMILMGGMYLLQMIDAHVDSHLKEFDLNPKLQVSIEPSFEQNAMVGRQTGVSLIVRF